MEDDEFAPLREDELSSSIDFHHGDDVFRGVDEHASPIRIHNDSISSARGGNGPINENEVLASPERPLSQEVSLKDEAKPLSSDDSRSELELADNNRHQTSYHSNIPSGSKATVPTAESQSKENGQNDGPILGNEMLRVVYCAPDAYSVSRFSDADTELSEKEMDPTTSPQRTDRGELVGKKLRFDTLGLYGREDEQQVLKTCLAKVSQCKQVVFVRGSSGTGKTALCNSLLDSVKDLGGWFVHGKFDPYHRNSPYSGILQACQQICGEIVLLRNQGEDEKHQSICQELVSELGSEMPLLRSLIPGFSEAFDNSPDCEDEGDEKPQTQEFKARILYAFRLFFREIAKFFRPLVIVLDDIHWADESSVKLMEGLIVDRFNESIMVVGIYRLEEVTKEHVLQQTIAKLEALSASEQQFHFEQMTIGDMDINSVQQVLNYLMDGKKHDEVRRLSVLCHKRTAGNVLHLVTFVRLLESKGLLTFDAKQGRWLWDKETILSETHATDNVVELIQKDMLALPENVRLRLVVASCLGHSFKKPTFDFVWESVSSKIPGLQHTTMEAELLWLDGKYLELCGSYDKSYRWVHDRIQEAALSLVEAEDLSRLKEDMGTSLLSKGLQSRTIIVTASLLNDGPKATDEHSLIQLAEINLHAAEYATSVYAFASAADFAKKGISNLPSDHWETQPELSLGLYSSAVEADGCLGRFMDMHEKAEIVLEQDIPLQKKLRVFDAKVDHIRIGQDAADLLVRILEDLQCQFPRGKLGRVVSMFRETFRMRSRIKLMTIRDIAMLPVLDDPTQVSVMKLLDKLSRFAYVCEDKNMMLLALLRSVSLTLDRGLCEGSATALASMGMVIVMALQDYETAAKCAQLCLQIIARLRPKKSNGNALQKLCGFVQCWSHNLNTLLGPLSRAREMCLATGDHTNSSICIYHYLTIGVQSGRPLDKLEDEFRTYGRRLLDFEKVFLYRQLLSYWDYVCVLRCVSKGARTALPDIEETSDQSITEEEHRKVNSVETSVKIRLGSILGEHEVAGPLALETGNGYAKAAPGHATIMADTFWRGISLFAMARATGRRAYRNAARKALSVTQSWDAKGNPNARHLSHYLNAEDAVIRGDHATAEDSYQGAISRALDGGFIHEAAHANERFFLFLLHERNDRERALSKLDEAVRLFEEWGAKKKVEKIREEYQNLWPQPQVIIVANDQNEQLDDAKAH
mmetsp:Transcript_14353/g.39912  ORF Transcript_14353/g.39912 Transcript_14353/m.39912 type:complete len:1206 (-) Transcript_14353:64-3681(-)